MKKIYIIDVSAMFFRAFYAVRPLTSPTGIPVNALYGYLSMIVKLLKEEKPDYLALCYDLKEPSFRKELYPEYKSHRTEMPEDLVKQIPFLRKLNLALGLQSFEKIGYEADDLIGTISEWGLKHQLEVFIVSGDKDFAQLVKPHVYLLDTMKNVKLDSQGVQSKWGILPEQFIDYLALMGDSSDNIPGVEGIGPKGAQKLISEFGSLEAIYENIDKITGKVREKLVKDKQQAFLSKKLVTIETQSPIDLDLEQLKVKNFIEEDLRNILEELNFKSFLKSLLDINSNPVEEKLIAQVVSQEVFTEISGKELLEKLSQNQHYVFLFKNRLYACINSDIFYVNKTESDDLLELTQIIKWRGFDLKSVWRYLNLTWGTEHQIEIDEDTMLLAYVIRSKNCTELAAVIKDVLTVEISEAESLSQINQYLSEVRLKLEEDLKNFDQVAILYNFEYPLIPILYKMEVKGFLINTEELKIFSEELKREIQNIEIEVHKISEDKFNLASPKQLAEVLFKKLGLESSKKTKTGFSTDNEVLEKLNHPIAKLILDFRELSKLKSTYVDVLPGLVNPKDHRIHTTFNQALTTTGRLSSSNPNLQNIPIKTLKGQRVRKSFIAEEGNKILSLDYSQIELRVLAHFSDDPGLKKAFQENVDIHAMTAAEVFSVKLENVTSELRRIAKAVNFGIAYGQGAFGLSETLNIPRGEASAIIKNYFEKFKNVKEYIDNTIKSAYEKNYVETLFGRRRYFPELLSKVPMVKKFGERAAINAPIQGTASDIVKLAMIKMANLTTTDLILQVHDELLFEGKEEDLLQDLPKIKEVMEGVVSLRVPLKVNFSIGKNWDEAH